MTLLTQNLSFKSELYDGASEPVEPSKSSFDGLGYGGEGFCSFTIASPTGEGLTNPISFSRIRRCVLKDSFRIV